MSKPRGCPCRRNASGKDRAEKENQETARSSASRKLRACLQEVFDRVSSGINQVAVISAETDKCNLAVVRKTLGQAQDRKIPHAPDFVLFELAEQHGFVSRAGHGRDWS